MKRFLSASGLHNSFLLFAILADVFGTLATCVIHSGICLNSTLNVGSMLNTPISARWYALSTFVVLCWLCSVRPHQYVYEWVQEKGIRDKTNSLDSELRLLYSTTRCGAEGAILPYLNALFNPGACMRRDKSIFTNGFLPDCRKEWPVDFKEVLQSLSNFYLIPADRKRKSATCTNLTLYKYSHVLSRRNSSAHTWANSAIILNELHASQNIAHASRDAVFLAHVLQYITPSYVIVSDPLAKSEANSHRLGSISAIVKFLAPGTDVLFLDGTNRPSKDMCFDYILRKPVAFAGFADARRVYRTSAHRFCNVRLHNADTILIEEHVGSRVWDDREYLIRSISKQPWAKGLKVVATKLNGMTFCQQVTLFYHAKVVFLHHGAAVEGNSPFMRDDALIVEIQRQQSPSGISPMIPLRDHFSLTERSVCGGQLQRFGNIPPYFGIFVGYVRSGRSDYYHTRERVLVNETLWEEALHMIPYVMKKLPSM